jgi:hypothetical protein
MPSKPKLHNAIRHPSFPRSSLTGVAFHAYNYMCAISHWYTYRLILHAPLEYLAFGELSNTPEIALLGVGMQKLGHAGGLVQLLAGKLDFGMHRPCRKYM